MSSEAGARVGTEAPLGYGTVYAREPRYRPQRVVQISSGELQRVLSRPPFFRYLALVWRRRHFIVADARARVESGNRSNLLGSAWLVLNPLLNGAVYFVVFGLILQTDRGIEHFLGYLIIGVFLFQFTIRCLVQGSRSLIAGRQMIRSFSFPRAAIPIATVIRETLRFIPALVTMIVLLLLIPPGVPVTWRWALVPLVFALQFVFNLGLVLTTARLVARIPDLAQIIPVFARFWLYASAVFFSVDRFASVPGALTVMKFNPMFVVLDMVRDCLLYAATPSATSWMILGGWTVGLLVLGSVYFWRGEESYGAL